MSGGPKLIFFLCLAATYFTAGSALELAQVKSAITAVNQDKQSPVIFTVLGLGEMFDADEQITLGFTSYKASDGHGLIAMDHEFGSASDAHIYFEKKLSRATKVIERRENFNGAGKLVGERAQTIIPYENRKIGHAVLWTDGKEFREITSSSLTNILKLEKTFRQ